MAYATPEELEAALGSDRFLSLVDRDADDSADTDAVASALETESGTIDLYIGRWLPISEPTQALKRLNIDLAVYELAGNHATEDEIRRMERAMRVLRDLQAGKASLDIPVAEAAAPSSAVVEANDSVFTRDQTRSI